VTEIRTAVDLHHPAERAWRALTDRRLLPQWFAATELEPMIGARFQLRPVDLPGLPEEIDGEIVELDEPYRMVMRWFEQDRQSLIVCDLTPSQDGCQFVLRQVPELGDWSPEDRELRQQTYDQLLAGRLPAVLDWLAFREVDFGADPPVEVIEQADIDAGQPPARRNRVIVLAAVVGLVGLAAVVLGIWSARTSEPAAVTATNTPTSSATATASGQPSVVGSAPATRTAGPTLSPSRPGAPPPATKNGVPPAQATLDARYSTVSNRLLAYTGEIVVNNTGKGSASDWAVKITVPKNATVSDVSGASYQQDGQTVTFTGAAVGPNGSARIQFDVGQVSLGAKQPDSCAVNGQACSGL
jgi:uncharacterized protein YndB with AHSA1/START domain